MVFLFKGFSKGKLGIIVYKNICTSNTHLKLLVNL